MFPRWGQGVKCVEIVETKCMGTGSSEQEKLVVYITQLHTSPWCRALTHNLNLRPREAFQIEAEKVIKSLRVIPATKNIVVVFHNSRRMVGSWRRSLSACFLNVSPVEGFSIEFMKVIQVVTSVSTPEHKDFVLVSICSVHVARPRWLTGNSKFIHLKVLRSRMFISSAANGP